METLETRRLFDASSEVVVDLGYRAEVNESASSDQGIFFVRDDARYGAELWATNPAGNSPRIVLDLTPGETGSRLRSITPVVGGVYFIRLSDVERSELWWSDGTAANTRMIADDIRVIERDFTERGLQTSLVNDGVRVFFERSARSNNDPSHSQLWAASDRGNVIEYLGDNESFADDVAGVWRFGSIDSMQTTTSGLSVFVFSATSIGGDTNSVRRRFYGFTDGTPEGTTFANHAVLATSEVTDAIGLSDDKIMFVSSVSGSSEVLTIDRRGTVEKLGQGALLQNDFARSGSQYLFASSTQTGIELHRTDGTVLGTEAVASAGRIHSSPVTLSDGSILTLAGKNFFERDFQVTNVETNVTSKLDFITPQTDLVRELYGQIVVGVDRFFYVESTGGNARRLMMADTRARTVTTILQGNANEAIGTPILRGEKLFFTYITPTRTDLMQFNIASSTSAVLASVATDGWLGLSIDVVAEDSLIGFMQGIDEASIFKLRFADSYLTTVSLVDEVVSEADLHAEAIRDGRNFLNDQFWKLDAATIAFSRNLVINGQSVLGQAFAYDASESGLHRLIPPSLPTPSNLISGAIYTDRGQPFYKAGGKIVYHSGYQVIRADGTRWEELWSTNDGQSAQKLMEVQTTGISGEGFLIPLGVVDDRLYFLSTDSATTLYRTSDDATSVELVSDTSWAGQSFGFHDFEWLYRPALADDAQRILFRRKGDADQPGIWEIAGSPPVLRMIFEPPAKDGFDSLSNQTHGVFESAGSVYVKGLGNQGPLVEVATSDASRDRMVSFFGNDSGLTFPQQETVGLYRLDGAWVGVVPGPDGSYTFWSRADDSSQAIRVSDFDIASIGVYRFRETLSEFALTKEAIVFHTGYRVIRLDRDGTYSFLEMPPLSRPESSYFRAQSIDDPHGFQQSTLLLEGFVDSIDRTFTLGEDGRSIRQVFVDDDATGASYGQIVDGERRFVLRTAMPHGTPSKVVRTLQDANTIELDSDQDEIQWSFAENRLVVLSGDESLYDGSPARMIGIHLQSTQPDAVVTFDLTSVVASTEFPMDGISLTLVKGSLVRLVGNNTLPITYQLDDAALKIRIGGLTIQVIGPTGLMVEDRLVALDRHWIYSAGDDDVVIRPGDGDETEFVELVRNVVIGVNKPVSGEGESLAETIARWRVNTKTGVDRLTIAPDVPASALLSVVSDLDNEARLSVEVPSDLNPLVVTRRNGRTFASVAIAGLEVMVDNTRRPLHNLIHPTDADNNGRTTALDALRIINSISHRQAIGESIASDVFADVNGDGRITALDALLVINQLARRSNHGGMIGESESHSSSEGVRSQTKGSGVLAWMTPWQGNRKRDQNTFSEH